MLVFDSFSDDVTPNTIVDVSGINILVGTSGFDQMFGLAGDDFISGAEADDQLFGNEGADTVYGHQDNDTIYGGSGADLLFGGQGDDLIAGDEGNDTIYGNKGTDILIGGEGENVFVLESGSGGFTVETTDLIVNFNPGEDRLELPVGLTFEDLRLEQTPAGDTAVRDINSGLMLALLRGVSSDSLTGDRFIQQIETESILPISEPISLSLANDTGLDNQDNITSDPTLTGTVANPAEVAGLEISIGEEFVPISTNIDGEGSFTLTQQQLEETLGISFADGIYTVELRSLDAVGTPSSEIAEITFRIAPDDNNELPGELVPPGTDMFEPIITAELANDTGTNDSDGITSDPTITGTATDNFGVAAIEVSMGGEFVSIEPNFGFDGSFTLTPNQLEEALNTSFADGSYTLFLRAVDTSGLRSLELAEVNFTFDNEPPTITAQLANDTGDSNSDRVTTDATITGTVSDDNEIVALRAGTDSNLLNVTNQLDADSSFEFDPLQVEAFLGQTLVENQTYTLKLEAEDEFGLVSQTTVSFTFADIPDETIPEIELPPPEEVEMINDDDDDEIVPRLEIQEREVTEDPGNTIEDATSIAVSSNTLVYSEEVSEGDSEDIYAFTLGASSNISIDLNGLSGDADLFLLDSNETILDSSEAIGITPEFIARPLEAGTYYIRVESFDGETTDYDLNVAFSSRLGIDLTSSGTEGGLFTDTSSSLIGLEPPPSNPDTNAFRSDPRFAGIDGSGFSVVVIDTGIDLDHPFFGPDNDGDGVADRIVYQYDFADDDFDASDTNGHGSNVTSIVASEDSTYTGMAPGANIIHLKVFEDGSINYDYDDLKQALSWVVDNADEYNIASVNMSLGGGIFSQALTPEVLSDFLNDPTLPEENRERATDFLGTSQLLEQIVEEDIIVVSASGNSFFEFESTPGVGYPSADINSLSVGAVWDSENDFIFWASGAVDFTTDADRIASFSQRHPILTDIFAPGPFSTGADANGGIVDQGGTSQAAPHIAGIAALAQQLAVQELGRRLTFEEFRTLIQDTGVTIFDGDDEDDNVFNTGEEYKRVDVLALGEAILELDPTTEPPEEIGLVRYDFAYLYDGESFDNDYYLGYTYAEPGTFDLNTFYDNFAQTNETGSNGLYFVFDDSNEVSSDAILNEVYVEAYFDRDTSGEVYTPYYFANGSASGFNSLGSEWDFITLEDGTFDDFGLDFYEADGVEQIFSNTRFTRTDYPANSEPGRMVNGDLDNDGRDELIVANTSNFDSGFSILFNEGDGSFERPLDFTTDFFSSGAGDDPSLDVGDIDGDGNIDLITVNPDTDEVSIYFNDGNGELLTPSTFDAGDRPVISETADIDSDGNTDVVLINSEFSEFGVGYEGDSLSVLFNRTDNNVFTLTAGEGVTDVVAADLDGDGDVDLATANEVEDTVSVLFNLGNITFTSPFTFDVGDRPVSIVADDFDGNGTVDLATSDFGSDTVSVLRNSGNGFFAPATTFETNEFPSTMSSADLDGDGDSDLVMRNSVFFDDGDREGNSISVLLNNGNATFNSPLSFTVGEVPVGLIVEDLDGNGQLDIATSNFDSQDVTVYLQS